jgi:hypothetical protein
VSNWRKIGLLTSAPTVLVGLGLGSYATSLFRERYLYQHSLGSAALDRAVVGLALASILGSAGGVVLSLAWLAGRIRAATPYKLLAIMT